MRPRLLNEISDGWRARLSDIGISIKDFCAISQIPYHTFHYVAKKKANPTIKTLDMIEQAIRKLEGQA